MTRSRSVAIAEQGVSEIPITNHWLCWDQCLSATEPPQGTEPTNKPQVIEGMLPLP